jgi:hypothetical protein
MKTQLDKIYAIITGDIVASSLLSSNRRKMLHKVMVDSSKVLQDEFKDAVLMGVDIFRGDSWQIILSKPAKALRLALFYRAILRAKMESHRFDTRMAIALGHVDFIPGNRASEGYGEAYQLSGKALESMPKARNMSFVFPGMELEKGLNVVIQLIDSISSRWSDKQALAVTGGLRGWKQEKIAEKWWKKKVSQQAVAQHLSRAGWYPVEKGILFFEQCLREE